MQMVVEAMVVGMERKKKLLKRTPPSELVYTADLTEKGEKEEAVEKKRASSSFVGRFGPADKKRIEAIGRAVATQFKLCSICGRRHPGECLRPTGGCFNCGLPGHRIRDCPKPRKEVPKREGPPPPVAQPAAKKQVVRPRVYALAYDDPLEDEVVAEEVDETAAIVGSED